MSVSWLTRGYLGGSFAAPFAKEGFQHVGGWLGLYTSLGLRSPVACRLVKEFWAMVDRAALGIIGPPDHPPDARMADGTGAHSARFQRYI